GGFGVRSLRDAAMARLDGVQGQADPTQPGGDGLAFSVRMASSNPTPGRVASQPLFVCCSEIRSPRNKNVLPLGVRTRRTRSTLSLKFDSDGCSVVVGGYDYAQFTLQ